MSSKEDFASKASSAVGTEENLVDSDGRDASHDLSMVNDKENAAGGSGKRKRGDCDELSSVDIEENVEDGSYPDVPFNSIANSPRLTKKHKRNEGQPADVVEDGSCPDVLFNDIMNSPRPTKTDNPNEGQLADSSTTGSLLAELQTTVAKTKDILKLWKESLELSRQCRTVHLKNEKELGRAENQKTKLLNKFETEEQKLQRIYSRRAEVRAKISLLQSEEKSLTTSARSISDVIHTVETRTEKEKAISLVATASEVAKVSAKEAEESERMQDRYDAKVSRCKRKWGDKTVPGVLNKYKIPLDFQWGIDNLKQKDLMLLMWAMKTYGVQGAQNFNLSTQPIKVMWTEVCQAAGISVPVVPEPAACDNMEKWDRLRQGMDESFDSTDSRD